MPRGYIPHVMESGISQGTKNFVLDFPRLIVPIIGTAEIAAGVNYYLTLKNCDPKVIIGFTSFAALTSGIILLS